MDLDISGLDKVDVLLALYESARPQGMGFMHFRDEPMPRGEAKALLERQSYFDYLHGRVMKVNLKGDVLKTALYDRDNGEGAALEALTKAGLVVKAAS